jgi:hypothetical protein
MTHEKNENGFDCIYVQCKTEREELAIAEIGINAGV